jgi:hypothetical protein
MKLTLLLCAITVFTGCSNHAQPGPARNPGVVNTPTNSPIIIADGSTHLRHKGTNNDFHIVNDSGLPHIIVSDPGYTATTLQCNSGVTCPNSNTPIPLTAGWTMDVFDVDSENSGTPIKILTISSADNMRIVTKFHRNTIDPENDSVTTGTDIISGNLTFRSATFTNGGGAAAIQLTCASSPCNMQINYTHP